MHNGPLYRLAEQAHHAATVKGFYTSPDRNIGELLMLCVTELAEAMEAVRVKYYCGLTTTSNKIIPQEKFEQYVKDSFEDEIADCFIRLLDLCGYKNIPIDWHIKQKMAYNKTRPAQHNKTC